MAENTHGQHSGDAEAETRTSKTEQQEQEEQRIETKERLSMDRTDMDDAIDSQEDQKFDGKDTSRYAEETEQALTDDTR